MSKVHMRLFFLMGVFLLGNACTEEQDYEVISIDKVLPQAEREYIYDEEEGANEEIIYSVFQEQLTKLLPEITFDESNTLKGNLPLLLPNRLGYEEKQEFYFVLDSIPFYFIQWEFSDSARTINAFYNWIDCFGSDCHSMKINEEKKLDKNAFAIWVHENSLTYLTSTNNFSLTTWEEHLFKEKEDIELYFLLKQNVKGRTHWVQLD